MNKLFLSFFIFCVSLSLQANTPQKLNLNQNWVFRQYNLGEWLPACVPGTIHTDLLNNGQIPDPFYRVNEDVYKRQESPFGALIRNDPL